MRGRSLIGVYRCLVGLLAPVALLLLTGNAHAYPQYIGRGDLDCSECHYSPTGGGLTNSWGRMSREATFGGDTDSWPGHSDATGYRNSHAQLQFDVGADVRMLPLVMTEPGGPSAAVFLPMLEELGGVAAYGPAKVYATLTGRKGPPSTGGLVPFSREHWLGFTLNPTWTLRTGRLVLPFGVRSPDHTQYVREDFGFGPWGQDYGAEVDAVTSSFSFSAAAFAGDLIADAPRRQQRGGVLRGTLTLDERAIVGVSVLGAHSQARDRGAGSLFGSVRLWSAGYVLAELAVQQQRATEGSGKLTTIANFERAGWFVLPELDVFAELGYRGISENGQLAKARYALGANWQATHWFEFLPQVMVEQLKGVGPELIAMGQLHLTY
ncbi:MAG TPA: hypothetical protein VHM70_02910 [Polyangiaceae bacterium]|nr:hypothetical protein [Polyangiaceae bacterium]